MSAMLRGSNKGKYMYDLIVIGGGSGGVRGSRIANVDEETLVTDDTKAATHGAKVALIEASMHHGPPHYAAIGGTCVNVGLMVYGSLFSHDLHAAQQYGWSGISNPTHDWSTFMEKKDKEISRLNGIYGRILGNAGVETFEGIGRLKSAHEVVLTGPDGKEEVLTTERVLISVGGWPFKPSIEGADLAITSNEIFYLKERPDRLVVVGGGYIAVEFAMIMAGFGSKVTLMYRRDLFLRGFDDDVRQHLADEMSKLDNIDLQFNTNPAKIEKNPDETLKITTEAGDEVEADCVLMATGRTPKTEDLGLDLAGVEVRKDGSIPVDEYSKTNVDTIFAIGDVTDRIQLTPVALMEGHCFADTVYGGMDRKPDHEYVPSAVFAGKNEIGSCGQTEEQAVEEYKDVTVFKSTFKPMLHTLTGVDTKMLMKIIVASESDRVVGVHICGEHAAEMIQSVAIAMKMGATKKDFDSTVGLHPSSAEELVTMRSPAYRYVDGKKEAKL
ncbi:Trypanothione reductase [Hondaea fermentalgiana]|uniref:Trypanothione reductase n=1 Tax=Hondaea fermentalgiana TaxID=2315210 RepID=A0A2R5G4T6_9STRA|nr:Trypanothione reductase [Hondaea fermentalgiana]|eukprot:GBG25339.1 Trypanothione reductase [Hondaea fermentalgiana]